MSRFQVSNLAVFLDFKGSKGNEKNSTTSYKLSVSLSKSFVYLFVCLFVYVLILFNLTEVSYKK